MNDKKKKLSDHIKNLEFRAKQYLIDNGDEELKQLSFEDQEKEQEIEALRILNQKQRTENKYLESIIDQRRRVEKNWMTYLYIYLAVITLLTITNFIPIGYKLSDTVLGTLWGAGLLKAIGVQIIIVKNLFPNPQKNINEY